MNWVDVTPEQISAAEQWWTSRTPEEIERDWPSPLPYSHRGAFAATAWRVMGNQERCRMAITLMKYGRILSERKPAVSLQPIEHKEAL